MRILAIETTSLLGSVALLDGQQPAPAVHWLSGPRRHTGELLPVIETILDEAGLKLGEVDRLAWSDGPGSFTGLRVGATVVRTLGMTLHLPVANIPTLDLLAHNACEAGAADGPLVVLQDALRGEAYAAVYTLVEGQFRVEQVAELVADPAALLKTLPGGTRAIGSAVPGYLDVCEACGIAVLPESLQAPSAGGVALLAREADVVDASVVVPNYLRRPSCEEVYEQKRAEAIARRQSNA